MVSNCPPKRRITGFERIEDRSLRGLSHDLNLHIAFNARQRPQMRREHNADHGSV
jgi:hypothetical protein